MLWHAPTGGPRAQAKRCSALRCCCCYFFHWQRQSHPSCRLGRRPECQRLVAAEVLAVAPAAEDRDQQPGQHHLRKHPRSPPSRLGPAGMHWVVAWRAACHMAASKGHALKRLHKPLRGPHSTLWAVKLHHDQHHRHHHHHHQSSCFDGAVVE